MGWKDTITKIEPQVAKQAAQPSSWRDTIESATPAINEQGVTDKERFLIKNLVANEPEVAETYLKKRGYETRINQGEIEVKKPGEKDFKVIDPDELSFKEAFRDLTDLFRDVVQTGAESAAELIPGAGRIAAPAATAAFETGAQTIAKELGVREEYAPSEIALQTGMTAAMPAVVNKGGKLIKAASGGLSDFIGKAAAKVGFAPKQNAGEIIDASRKLGIEVQPAQIIDSKWVRKTQEDIIDRDLRPTGFMRRRAVENAQKTAKEISESVISDRSNKTIVQAGTETASTLTTELAEKLKPAEEIYDKYETKFRFIKPKMGEFKETMAGYIKDNARDKDVVAVIEKARDAASDIKNLDDLKLSRTAIGNMMRKAEPGTTERQVLGRIYGDLTELRSKTLLDRAKGEPESFYNVAKKEITQADKIYKGSIEAVEDLFGRGRKIGGSPKRAMEGMIEKTREADLPFKIFDLRDPKRLAEIKQNFPKSFELARKQQIEDIASRAMDKDQLSFTKLAKIISDLPDETSSILLGPDKATKVKALSVIADSLPRPTNPSGTADKIMRNIPTLGGPLAAAQYLNPKMLAIPVVLEVVAMTKNELLNIISNPVTRQGFLNKIANSSIEKSKGLEAIGRFGAKQIGTEGLMDLIPQGQ